MLSLSTGLSVFAVDDGDTIRYTSDHIDDGIVKFHTTIDGVEYGGVCCQVGIQSERSGTATAHPVSRSNRLTKLLYKYGIERGWYDGPDSTEAVTVNGSRVESKFLLLSHIAQVTIQGRDTFIENGHAWMGYSEEYCRDVADWVEDLDDSSIEVPSWYKVVRCNVEGAQNFSSFVLMPSTGKLMLRKASANTAITG